MTSTGTTPTVALVMLPGLEDQVLDPRAWDRLDAVARVVSRTAYARVDHIEPEHAAGVDVLLTGWGCHQIDGDAIARLPNLRLVAHAAGTVKALVSDALYDAGAVVTSAADANAIPVAEFTVAAMVMATKQAFALRDQHRTVRGTEWVTLRHPDIGNRGRTIGLLGASRIGRLVADRLRGFDADVLITDPFLTDDDATALGATKVELDELCRRSDILSIHAPDLPETRHLIGDDQLRLLRDGAWLINTARGSIVDTDALTTHAVAQRLHAFLDTTDPEPLPEGSPLYDLENVVITPHIAGSLGNEIGRMGDAAVTEIERLAAGESAVHPVDRTDLGHIA